MLVKRFHELGVERLKFQAPQLSRSLGESPAANCKASTCRIGGALCRAGEVGHYVDLFWKFEATELRAAVVEEFTLSRVHFRTQNEQPPANSLRRLRRTGRTMLL